MAITIEKIGGIKNKLGEGPVWDVAEKALYWIDGSAPAIHRLDPKTGDIRSWKTPKSIGSLALREKGGAVCALSDGFYLFDFKSGEAQQVGGAVAKPGTTFNDGKTDARGRFVAGTLDSKFQGENAYTLKTFPIAARFRTQPAKRGSGFPFTPSPRIANRLPPSAPGSILRTFSPIEVAYITSRLSPPNMRLVMIGTGTSTVRAVEPSGL